MSSPPRPTLSAHRFREELDRLFREAMGLASGPAEADRWQPAIDVVETLEALLVLVEVPGLAASDLRVEVQGASVIIAGHKRPTRPDPEARYHRLERGRGTFERTIELSEPVNTHRGVARLRGGVLTVEFPRVQEKRERRRILVVEEDGEEST